MITAKKMNDAIVAFALLKGIEVKEGGEKFRVRLMLPPDAINALMSDFMEQKNSPTFKLDEDQQFYAKCKSENISLLIQEGKTYKLELLLGNQEIEEALVGG